MASAGASAIGQRLLLSTGQISGSTTMTFTQSSANTPAVYQSSVGKSADGLARSIAVTPVIASGNTTFENFDVIYFLPTNLSKVQLTFENGWTEEYLSAELEGLYLGNNPAELNGLVNGFNVIQGMRGPNGYRVTKAVVYATSGGNVDVVVSGWKSI